MDIYLNELTGGRSFTFPSLPEQIQCERIDQVSDIQCDPIRRHQDTKRHRSDGNQLGRCVFRRSKKAGIYCKALAKAGRMRETVKDWQEKGTILRLLVTETNINVDVTMSKYDIRGIWWLWKQGIYH